MHRFNSYYVVPVCYRTALLYLVDINSIVVQGYEHNNRLRLLQYCIDTAAWYAKTGEHAVVVGSSKTTLLLLMVIYLYLPYRWIVNYKPRLN